MRGPLKLRSTTRAVTIVGLLLLAVFLVSGVYTVGRVRERFHLERIRARETMVTAVASAARIALLGDETLSLHTLVEGTTRAEGLAYAVILDSGKRVKAKAEPTPQTFMLKEIAGSLESIGLGEQHLPQTDVLPSGARILRFSRPVTFMNKNIGYVILGFSKDVIDSGVRAESRFLWAAFGVLGVCAFALLAGALIFVCRAAPPQGDDGENRALGKLPPAAGTR